MSIAGVVQAAPVPGDTMTYRVHHEAHGDLGRHRLTFSRDGDALVVETDSEITFEFLMFTAFRYTAKRREVWRDGRLVAFESDTHDDGEDIRISAEAGEGGLLIEGANGRRLAALDAFPTHPWNRDIVGASVLMDTTTGDLHEVTVTEVGPETLQIDGREIAATKFKMTGDYEREIWFDEEGAWVHLRFYKFGDAITYTLLPDVDSTNDLVLNP